MRFLIASAVCVATVGCQGKAHREDHAASGSASKPVVVDAAVDWVTPCEAALKIAPATTATRRVMTVINGCKPFGDWTPLLEWQTTTAEGGPKLVEIERMMAASHAYCTNAGQQTFGGALDVARGQATERPWRRLAEVCGAAMSAEAEPRFMSAPFFILDRIARAAAAEPRLALLLPAIDLVLPAWSSSGAGMKVAKSAVTKPEISDFVVTVTQTEIYAGTLAHAALSAAGVTVNRGAWPYPGAAFVRSQAGVPRAIDEDLYDIVKKAPPASETIAIIAPSAIRAHRVIDALAATGDGYSVMLAVAAPGGPPGWTLLGTNPVHLTTTVAKGATEIRMLGTGDGLLHELSAAKMLIYAVPPVLAIDDAATAADLARILGVFAFKGVTQVTLAKLDSKPAP